MSPGESWQVVLHDDEVNQFPVVHHLLREICGHDAQTARDLTMAVHESGSAVAGVYERQEAEAITLELVRSGLRATFGRAG